MLPLKLQLSAPLGLRLWARDVVSRMFTSFSFSLFFTSLFLQFLSPHNLYPIMLTLGPEITFLVSHLVVSQLINAKSKPIYSLSSAQCTTGQYEKDGACTECPLNTYSSSTGASECTACSGDKGTVDTGSDSESDCKG